MRAFFVSALMVLNTACATTPKAHAGVKGLDTFGSKRISANEVSQQYGSKINDWVIAGKNQKPEYQTFETWQKWINTNLTIGAE